MHGKETFNTDTRGDTAHGKGLTYTCPLPSDDDALKHLNTLTRSLNDAGMDAYRIARPKLRNVRPQLLFFQNLDDIHRYPPSLGCS